MYVWGNFKSTWIFITQNKLEFLYTVHHVIWKGGLFFMKKILLTRMIMSIGIVGYGSANQTAGKAE